MEKDQRIFGIAMIHLNIQMVEKYKYESVWMLWKHHENKRKHLPISINLPV